MHLNSEMLSQVAGSFWLISIFKCFKCSKVFHSPTEDLREEDETDFIFFKRVVKIHLVWSDNIKHKIKSLNVFRRFLFYRLININKIFSNIHEHFWKYLVLYLSHKQKIIKNRHRFQFILWNIWFMEKSAVWRKF